MEWAVEKWTDKAQLRKTSHRGPPPHRFRVLWTKPAARLSFTARHSPQRIKKGKIEEKKRPSRQEPAKPNPNGGVYSSLARARAELSQLRSAPRSPAFLRLPGSGAALGASAAALRRRLP